ncbi:MAG: hypothetical protein LBH80_04335 [Prevotellaceae bacterium]|jgi:hypothetical protein|nr:hypothetical protein [Prevotellaceae bacterium]
MKKMLLPTIKLLDELPLERTSEILENDGARDSIEQLNWIEKFNYRPITFFYVARSETAIYIKYHVHGSMLRAVYSEDMSPVHGDSCVEFFCKLPGSSHYMNFEFNCIGTCSAAKRKARNEDVTPYTRQELSLIKRFSSIGRRVFKELNGMFEWDLTVKIPFLLMDMDANNLPEKLTGNFYKCADDTSMPHYVSWNPVKTELPDFHRPEFFGEIYL